MLDSIKDLVVHFLNEEDAAWREKGAADYDQAVCRMIGDIRLLPCHEEQAGALTALCDVSLRRDDPVRTESLALFGYVFLELGMMISNPETRFRLGLFFLRIWAALAGIAARCPESVHANPELPEGVCLPSGADPALIADDHLRESAETYARQHLMEVERWNAGQRAMNHLIHLAALACSNLSVLYELPETKQAFLALMEQAAGLPETVLRQLRP